MLSGNRLPRNVSTPPMATSRSLGVRDQRPGGSTWKATTCVSFYASVCVWACVVHVIAEQSGYECLHHCIQRSVCRHVSTHCGKILVARLQPPPKLSAQSDSACPAVLFCSTWMFRRGNAYLRSSFPRLSYILRARPLDWVPVGGRSHVHGMEPEPFAVV